MAAGKNIVKYWGWFHIGFIAVVCCYSAYHKYCKFNRIKEMAAVKAANQAVFTTAAASIYGHLTGTGAGYGFFAPQVKSTGLIIGDCDGQQITADVKNFESMMRFGMMASHVTDYLLEPDDSQIADSTMAAKYYNLLFKSIAVKIYNQNKCRQDTLFMSYNMVMFPTLKAYRLGARGYALQKIKEVKIVKNN